MATAPAAVGLTKDDTRALWYAVEALGYQVAAMRDMDFTDEQRQSERALLLAAKRALRKANAIRKSGR